MQKTKQKIRIGTRGSKLALWQAHWVGDRLKDMCAGLSVEIQVIKTSGDLEQRKSLSEIGGKALFTKEIEDALLNGSVDIAVHSLKDLPAFLPKDLGLSAVPVREDPRDVLVSQNHVAFDQLKPGTLVGTSSLRRLCQLKSKRSDLKYVDIRGNVDTRLKKVREGQYGATVLAAAGLNRLGLAAEISEHLDLIPAPGQGALAIEARVDNKAVSQVLEAINDDDVHQCVLVERAFSQMLGGTCNIPLGCYAELQDSVISIEAFLSDVEGLEMMKRSVEVRADQAIEVAKQMAMEILNNGGQEILKNLG